MLAYNNFIRLFSNMAETYNRMYAVVRFSKQKGQRVVPINLVPGSWVTFHDRHTGMCKYPPRRDYHQLDAWREQLKSPDSQWKVYKVAILARADNLQQGLLRCDRACMQSDCASTDSGYVKRSQEPQILTGAERDSILQRSTKIHESPVRRTCPKKPTRFTTAKPLSSSSTKKYHRLTIATSSDDSIASPPLKNLNKAQNRSVNISDFDTSEAGSTASGTDVSLNGINSMRDAQRPNSKTEVSSAKTLSSSVYDASQVLSASRKPVVSALCVSAQALKTSSEEKLNEIVELLVKEFAEMKGEMHSMKRSLLYDLHKRFDMINTNMAAMKRPAIMDLDNVKATLEAPLPLGALEDFLEFDLQLSLNEEKRKALTDFYLIWGMNHLSVDRCITILLPAIFTKVVQSQLSGQGKKSWGSETQFQRHHGLCLFRNGDERESWRHGTAKIDFQSGNILVALEGS